MNNNSLRLLNSMLDMLRDAEDPLNTLAHNLVAAGVTEDQIVEVLKQRVRDGDPFQSYFQNAFRDALRGLPITNRWGVVCKPPRKRQST